MSQLKKTARRGRIMGSWTEESMKEAIKEVKKGNDSIRKIGDRYKIPASSIRDWMSGKTSSKKKGPRTVLSKEEEDVIVEWCVANQRMSRGITFYMLRKKVADVCQGRETPFKDGIPGKRWLEWFRKRHPSVIIEPAHALKGKKRPESEKEVLVAKNEELSPSRLLVDSDRDISTMKFVKNSDILGPILNDISKLEDHESHVILTQTFNEDECVLVSTSDTMKGYVDDLKSSLSEKNDNCIVSTSSCIDQKKNKISQRQVDKFDGFLKSTHIKHEQENHCLDDHNVSHDDQTLSLSIEALDTIVEPLNVLVDSKLPISSPRPVLKAT